MGKITLALFGPPEVYHQGQLLHFPTRKSLALLIYLAVERGLHPREKLDALFWPESAPRQARAALRNTLLRLRSALDLGTQAGPSYILQDGERLGINPLAGVELDLHILDAFLAGARRGEASLGAIGKVVALPRGDFLEGFSLPDAAGFDDWAAIQREYWYQKLDQALSLASQEQIDAGQAAGALETAQRWAALHPLNEAAYRRLMEAYLAAGNREAALRAYTACEKTLYQQLGVEPAEETRDLAARIRALPPRPSIQTPRSRPVTPLTTLELPLVGRVDLHRSLVQAFLRCKNGALQAVFLEGEPGIGKTRLARDFQDWAVLQGAEVVSGRAFEAGGRLPYQAVAEALSQLLSSPRDWAAKLGPARLSELARIIPALQDLFPQMPVISAEGDAQAQLRLFDAAARVIETLAEAAPLVWLVDDLQWVDSASLDLLQYLAHRWSQTGSSPPVLFLFTLREPGLDASAGVNLDAWLAGWSRDVSTQRHALRPIGEEDVSALVSALSAKGTGEAGERAFSRWLYRETEGQPLYILETLKALIEWGLIHPQRLPDGSLYLELGSGSAQGFENAEAVGLPSGIRDLIRARLARISQGGLSLLAAGAVLGKGFPFQLAASIAGLEEEAALSALDELLASGLLAETSSGEDPAQPLYLFSHDKVREVVGLGTNAARSGRLHRRAFEALEQGGASAAELSHHALAGGLRVQGFQYSIRAGDQALGLYALREAVRHYHSALEVGAAVGKTSLPGAEQALPGLFLNLGRAHELLNEFEPAREAYLRMAAFAEQAQRVDLHVIAINRQATLLAWQNFDLLAARELLQQALRLAEDSADGLSRFETTWNLAQLGMYVGDAQCIEYAHQALALAHELERPDLLARGWNVVAHVHSLSYEWNEVEQAAKEALQINRRLEDRAMQAENLALLSQAQVNMGRIAEGLESARRALGLAEEIENAWGQVFASFALGLALVDAGEYQAALAVTREGMETAGQFQFPALRLLSFTAYGVANLALFRPDEVHREMRQALEFNQVYGRPSLYSALICCLECAAHALTGSWAEAAQAAKQVVQARQDQADRGFDIPIWLEVDALLRAGEEETARRDFAQIAVQTRDLHAQKREYPRQRYSWLMARGVLARWSGDYSSALEDFNEAFHLAQQVGSPMERIAALKELARTCRVTGQLVDAGDYLGEAKKIVAELAGRIQDEVLRGHYLAGATHWLAADDEPG